MIKIPFFLEKIFTIFMLLFYTRILAIESVFISSEGETGLILPSSTPLDPILSLVQHGSALLILVLLKLHWNDTIKVFRLNPFIWLLTVMVLFSASWSDFPELTQRRSLALLETSLFSIYFASRYSIKEQIRLVTYVLGITAILSFLFTLALPSRALEQGVHIGAWRGPFSHKNQFARLMTLSCMASLLVTPVDRKERYLLLLFLGLSFILILLSTSKTALFVGLILFLIFQVYKIFRWKGLAKISFLLIILLVGGVILMWLTMNIESIITVSGRDLTLSGRTKIWPPILDKVQDRPWLGYGYLGFWHGLAGASAYVKKAYGTTYVPPHSHNGFLELLLAFGIVGAVLFTLSFVLVARRALLAANRTQLKEGLWPLMYLSFLILYNQTEATLVAHNSIYWVLYVSLALSPFISPSLLPQSPVNNDD
jgi:exopolysaccharide production protein ExoQ